MVALERRQSIGEEIANSLSHGLGFVAALAAAPVLIASTAQRGHAVNVVGSAVFATTMVLLYCASTFYHAVPHERAKALLRKLDHGAIYLLIAGTYTPFTLGALNGPLGWVLLGVVWSLAVVGVALKAFDRIEHPLASLGLYLLMGWLFVVAAELLVERVALPGLLLLAGGGFAYMAGIAFFATDARIRYGHFIWHLFVLAGTSCHFFAVLGYAT
ncbi:MAG TPA: hemolysin III family protein [Casimicrobiaceae bacterium]|nr:hemolysin III family protein [Casimicrobiaceae bacterium]